MSCDNDRLLLCRVCLKVTDLKTPLFKLKYAREIFLSDMFTMCTSIQLQVEKSQDSRYSYLCKTCLKELTSCYLFIKKCKASDEIVKNKNNVVVVVEVKEVDVADENTSEDEYSIFRNKCTSESEQLEESRNDVVVTESKTEMICNTDYLVDEDSQNIDIETGPLFDSSDDENSNDHVKEVTYACDFCGKSYTKKPSLIKHLNSHTGKKIYPCELCDKWFKNNTSYKHHLDLHSAPTIPCGLCDKMLKSPQAWKKHQLVHNKKFVCKWCAKTFAHSTHLNEHNNMHLGLKPYICSVCSKSFFKKRAMTLHELLHLEVRPFPCNLCEGSFVTKDKLSRHKRQCHTKK